MEAGCVSTGIVTTATPPRSTTPSHVTQKDAVLSKSPHHFLCVLASQKTTPTDRRERWLESGELLLLSSPRFFHKEMLASS